MSYTPLKERENVKKRNEGNNGVRYTDSTAKVAGIIHGGMMPSAGKGSKRGCSSCGK
ncbi:hypothetical protein [Rodentibacter pneumotropicus]|uniref:hypothetical protein n=1 Tax=Rodentibacter pneumotropicus TaxID=758 RepID=UPI0015C38A2F|nr:hypothetical protein [Rodentibacter pneumotropicus]